MGLTKEQHAELSRLLAIGEEYRRMLRLNDLHPSPHMNNVPASADIQYEARLLLKPEPGTIGMKSAGLKRRKRIRELLKAAQ